MCLAYHRLEFRVAPRPELDEAGVVLDGTPAVTLALGDPWACRQPLGRAGIQEIVRQAPAWGVP